MFGHDAFPLWASEASFRCKHKKEFSIPPSKPTLSLWTILGMFLFVDYLLDGVQVLTEAVCLSQQVIFFILCFNFCLNYNIWDSNMVLRS